MDEVVQSTWTKVKPNLEKIGAEYSPYVAEAVEEIDERISDMRRAVGALRIDLNWLMSGAGTHVTIDTKKLITLLKAAGKL